MVMCATWTTYRKKKKKQNSVGKKLLGNSEALDPHRPGFSATKTLQGLFQSRIPFESLGSHGGVFRFLANNPAFSPWQHGFFFEQVEPMTENDFNMFQRLHLNFNHRIASQNIWEQIVEIQRLSKLVQQQARYLDDPWNCNNLVGKLYLTTSGIYEYTTAR